jgi:signal transduction histidine kinase
MSKQPLLVEDDPRHLALLEESLAPLGHERVAMLLQLKESRDELRRLNKELASQNAVLERLQRDQRELTEFVVHDLRNPLAAIWSNVEFARGRVRGDAEISEALDDASHASGRLNTMIEDLLRISRLEESALPLRVESVPLSDLMGEIFDEYARLAAAKRVELLGPSGTSARVRADRALLRRIIENILDNSLRFTPEHGRVRVTTRVDDSVEIAISNTGPSIPPPERDGIFEKFGRVRAGVVAGNSGMGLYFCKRATQALGGDIRITDLPEWPTSFVVRLPASP